jgi:hypothetical protein
MAQIVCYEVFPTERNIRGMRLCLVHFHGFKEKQNHVGPYFYTEVSSIDAWMTRSLLKLKGYKFRSFDKRYERNSNYRKTYFEHNEGPYHCTYCGRRIKAEDLEVDHLIPVAKAKSSIMVRTWLHLCGITNVNSYKNLVSSCEKCNRKKSDKMGFWIPLGIVGRYKMFWTIRNIIVALIITAVIYIAYSNDVFINLIDFVSSLIEQIL